MGKKRCQLHFVFFLLFLNSDREIACLEFSRLSGEGKEELVLAVLILHKKKLLPGHVSLFSWSFSVTVKLNLNFYSLRLCVSNYLDL